MKDVWLESLGLFAGHWGHAMLQGGVFLFGALSAIIVLRHRLLLLMRFPLWMARKLLRFLATRPGFAKLFFTIFCFNSVAIFAYMMTGALDPMLPSLICFLTGMHVALVAALMPAVAGQSGELPLGATPGNPPEMPSRVELICFLVTLGLELPVFWVSIAMGWTMTSVLGDSAVAAGELIQLRMQAYAFIAVPALAVSALAEATGIWVNLRRQPRQSGKAGSEARDA